MSAGGWRGCEGGGGERLRVEPVSPGGGEGGGLSSRAGQLPADFGSERSFPGQRELPGGPAAAVKTGKF